MDILTRFRFIISASTVLVLSATLCFARPQHEQITNLLPESDIIINDPEVRQGILPNGLTYYVQFNATPADIAELRLVIRAGSALEDDDQKGLAHVLEHMLFNGTEKYPGDELVDVLESFGMEYGPDLNAYTNFNETVYKLSVKSDNRQEFNTGLDVLKEWAFHATLDEEQFENERAVIYEEWRSGRGVQARLIDQSYPILLKDSQYAKRLPIGDMDIVRNAPLSALERFYKDWYRPDMMAVIVVGDIDPDETVRKIENIFGGQPKPANPRPRTEYPIPRHDETSVKVLHDSEKTNSSIQLFVKFDTPIQNVRTDYRQVFAQQLFHEMLNQRLEEVRLAEDSPFLYGQSYDFIFTTDTSFISLEARVNEEEALAGLEAVLIEIERVKRYGFLMTELERRKAEKLSVLENYWKQRHDFESAGFISHYINAFVKDQPYPSIDWLWDAGQELIPQITLDEVDDTAQELLSDKNRVLFIAGPSVPAIIDIQEDEIDRILQGVKTMDIDPWTEEPVIGPLVENPPTPGSILSRSTVPGTDIVFLTLSNGARILYKATDFKNDEILFRAVSLGGSSLIDNSRYISSQFATSVMDEGGLGNFSQSDLNKILTGKNVRIQAFIADEYEGINGQTISDDMEYLFQFIYLLHTAPRRDEVSWNAMMNIITESLKNRELSPQTLYFDKLRKTLYNNHFRAQPLTSERLSEATLDEAISIFTERFREGGDFTYIFVGDFNPSELESYAIKWLANLPAPASPESWKDQNMRYFKGKTEFAVEAGVEPLSLVNHSWTGEWDGSYSERYRMHSLADALEMKLTKTIREEYSGTYSVEVSLSIELIPAKQYGFIISYTCDPDRVDELSARLQEIIQEWRTKPSETRFAEDIVAHQKRNLKENLEYNNYWINQIRFAVLTGTDPAHLINEAELYETLTPEVLRKTTERYFNDENYIEAVLYPAPKKDDIPKE